MSETAPHALLEALDAEIRSLIEGYLAKPFTSHSSLDNIVTGNAYQSVRLRGEVLPGFRAREAFLYAGLPMEGARFVDLGANLGEKTRLAAENGALYAEGIEYEPLFVRIGGLVSVYNGMANVALRQGDITQPGCVRGEFDLGACFSAFVYLRQNLAEVLGRLRGLFLLETHALDAGWVEQYLGEITPILPHWMLVGFTDHGRDLREARRVLIVFGRDRAEVEMVGLRRVGALPPDHPDIRRLDLERSPRIARMWGENEASAALFRDLRERLRGGAEPAAALRQILPALAGLVASRRSPGRGFGSDRTWLGLLTGLVEFLGAGTVAPGNAFLATHPDMEPAGAAAMLEEMAAILGGARPTAPLLLHNPLAVARLEALGHRPLPDEHLTLDGADAALRVQRLDGQPRLAALWLAGAPTCPVLPVWTNGQGFGQDAFALFDEAEGHEARVMEALGAEVLAHRAEG